MGEEQGAEAQELLACDDGVQTAAAAHVPFPGDLSKAPASTRGGQGAAERRRGEARAGARQSSVGEVAGLWSDPEGPLKTPSLGSQITLAVLMEGTIDRGRGHSGSSTYSAPFSGRQTPRTKETVGGLSTGSLGPASWAVTTLSRTPGRGVPSVCSPARVLKAVTAPPDAPTATLQGPRTTPAAPWFRGSNYRCGTAGSLH